MEGGLTHGSLFSGIGGFDLAAEWAGFKNIFYCEKDEFCRKVLKYHFPKSIGYEDIKQTNFKRHRGQINVLSGGFPCQPFSVAGQRKGAGDDRYLWDEMLRAIREIDPSWVIGENVAGITSMVQPGKTISVENYASIFKEDNYAYETIGGEYVIENICKDIESIGYSVQPFIIPACAVGAPHRRDRVWIVAQNANNLRRGSFQSEEESRIGEQREPRTRDNGRICNKISGASPDCTDTGVKGLQQERKNRIYEFGATPNATSQWRRELHNTSEGERAQNSNELFGEQHTVSYWESFPTQSPICGGDDGIPKELDSITFPKWRRESIKAYGNAIVSQVAYQIFKSIKKLT